MATQMQPEAISAGNPWSPASCEAETTTAVNKDKNGKQKLLQYPCCLKYQD